ncbi:MAG TPA: cobalamin-dependent protein, partial [Bacillota bacterium]|nr:cobalamin-dependent protein [Bacillota bacterium]
MRKIDLNGRKARMLLVYPDYTDRDLSVKSSGGGGNYQEGLASISAVLKQGGHSVKLFHLHHLYNEEDFKKELLEKGEFDVIGFSIRTTAFPDCQSYIKWTREEMPDVFIICGGYHCTLIPEQVMAEPDVDSICIGDGEYAELELLDKMTSGEDYSAAESLWF